MIFLELSIILSVYSGTHAVRSWRKRRRAAYTPQLTRQTAATEDNEDVLKDSRHHSKLSGVAVVTCSAGAWLYPPIGLLNLGLITYTTTPAIERALLSLRRDKRIQNDTYSVIIAALCVGGGQYFAAAMHNLIYHIAGRMEGESKQDTAEQMSQAFLRQPHDVWVLRDGIEIELPLTEIKKDDELLVRAGDVLAVDGEILAGHALIDQQILTGEIQPADKRAGDSVYASTLVLEGRIHIRAACSGTESQAHQLEDILHQTRDYKNQFQLKGEAWANKAALPLLGGSALLWPLVGIAPAAALLFSAPMNSVRALLSLQTNTHLKWSAEQGILIKDGRVLEELPWIDTVLFDKTGTLTESRPQVSRIFAYTGFSQDDLLGFAAAAEQHMYHPIAEALLNEAKTRRLQLPEIANSQYEPGLGISAGTAQHRIHVGSLRFMRGLKFDIPRELEQAARHDEGHTLVFVAIDNTVQGAIELYPHLRPEIPALLKALRQRGVKNIAMVSGDTDAACQSLGRQLGMDAVYAEVMPQGKADLIRGLQSQGRRVCFIGDGLNDAIAMKQANVSVCLGSAADLTSSSAQIVLVDDNLSHLTQALELAAHLHIRLGGSLGFWVSFGLFNALCVPLLHFGPLQSSLLYASAFGTGFYRARSPGWLERPQAEKALRGRDIELVEALSAT